MQTNGNNANEPFSLTFYRGVIENNISPVKDGRVQVRIITIHDDDKKAVMTEHLPWAEVMQSPAFGFSSGIGFSSIPNIGTWVWLFLDHGNPNMPVVVGAISGKSAKAADSSLGFNHPKPAGDPYIFPIDTRLNEEDQNRLQRVEKLSEGGDPTIHKKINDTRDILASSDGCYGADASQEEPYSLSDKTKYPDNAVIETKSGHVIEIDDTPKNEKLRVYHRSGTYWDFRPDGSYVFKSVSKPNHDKFGDLGLDTEGGAVINHEILEGHLHKHIMKSIKQHINENMDEIIKGYVNRYIQGTLQEHILAAVERTIGSTLTEHVSGLVDENYQSGQITKGGPHIVLSASRIDLN